ncbi:Uncharacterised protein [Vibrio cholerae]|uniref:Uncharacterized protein n=1 Tax=Vibrio cholerae TaxID=666 RepID=A0A655YGX4_VIBCL|nr:Uncharacterised protein [Vibrio cholerae]
MATKSPGFVQDCKHKFNASIAPEVMTMSSGNTFKPLF